MPVRDRRYENMMQFIFGGLIALALLYELLRHLLRWGAAIVRYVAANYF